MLNVVFACGAVERVPFAAGRTVLSLLEEFEHHSKSLEPAPGRERAYLAAAVNSVLIGGAVAAKEDAAALVESGNADASAPPSVVTAAHIGCGGTVSSGLFASAFLDAPPFPPMPLSLSATLQEAGVKPEGRVLLVYLPPQMLKDPTAPSNFKSMSMVPARFIRCQQAQSGFGLQHDVVVYCDDGCGRSGVVCGGDPWYPTSCAICSAAVHAGALKPGKPGYFTVRMCGSVDSFPAVTRNGITAIPRVGVGNAMSINPYLPGDEDTLANR